MITTRIQDPNKLLNNQKQNIIQLSLDYGHQEVELIGRYLYLK